MKRTGDVKGCMIALCTGVFLTVSPGMTGYAAFTVPSEPGAVSEARWEQQEDGWYYYDEEGKPASGWILSNEKYFYLDETGRCLVDTITPDGYFVDGDGVWQVRRTELLGTEFCASETAAFIEESWNGMNELKTLQRQIGNVFRKRRIRMTDLSIEYLAGDEDKVLLGIYKNIDSGSYRMDIRLNLDRENQDTNQASFYDYAVFQAFLYQVTSTPDYLEDALYSSWKEDNRWGINRNTGVRIGDREVKYTAGNQCGYYYIIPVETIS